MEELVSWKNREPEVAAVAVAAVETSEEIKSTEDTILKALEKLLNDEWLTYYQYWTAYKASRGPGKYDVDPEFEEHAENEKHHADLLMQRINQLGGKPLFDPTCWKEKAHEWEPLTYTAVKPILKVIKQSEETAIKGYTELIHLSADVDPTTHLMAVEILADELDHLYDIERLFEAV